jgi:DtxR family transcriptional regulator, Mn-dependent transcriptional regulator
MGPVVEDYLKAIYKIAAAGEPCTLCRLSAGVGTTRSAVAKMARRLEELRLVSITPGHELELGLTPAGEKIALEVIRHHRLLELYLAEALGYTWDQVHSEAEQLEHAISEEFEEKIDRLLGFPIRDPHGDPIPTRDGRIEELPHASLGELEPGQEATVSRVSDADPERLRYLGQLGLYPDTRVQMLAREPFGGPLRLRVAGTERSIGVELARSVFVSTVGLD